MDITMAMSNVKFHTATIFEGRQLQKKRDAHLCLPFNKEQLKIGAHPHRVDLWTDGSVEHSGGDPDLDEEDRDTTIKSGGSWLTISYPSCPDIPYARGDISLGGAACSYSAEREAMRAGFAALLEDMSDLQPKVVRVISDSLSCLQELEKGPYNQCEEATEYIWAALSTLKCEVHFIFIYSHMEEEEEEGSQPDDGSSQEEKNPMKWAIEVDEMAEKAVNGCATTGQWPLDILRPNLKAARAAAKQRFLANPVPRVLALGPKASSDLKVGLKLSRRRQVLLMQLRTGACPLLGGWCREAVSPCRHCGVPTGRRSWAESNDGQVATFHLFECPAFPTLLTREAPWIAPIAAVDHLLAFLDLSNQL